MGFQNFVVSNEIYPFLKRNKNKINADVSSLIAGMPSPGERVAVTESPNRDLKKVPQSTSLTLNGTVLK